MSEAICALALHQYGLSQHVGNAACNEARYACSFACLVIHTLYKVLVQ